jgi:homoaconitase/3-isopropylmalate dehydratase large subunit/isocitrate/isopropylmalate dehydrogenase
MGTQSKMHVTKDPQNFKLTLLPVNDALGAELISYARRILSLIQKIRQNDIFEISEYVLDGAATGPGVALQTYRNSDAVITSDLEGYKWKNHFQKGLEFAAEVIAIRLPIAELAQRSSYKADILENLDITVIQDFGIENDDCEESGRTERVDFLVNLAAGYSMKSLPEKPIHIICSDDIIVGSASWKDTVMNTLQSKFSGIKGNYMSITDAATVLSHNPTTLNGVILTNSDVVSNQAAGIIECPYIFPSASVSASQGGKPRGVFSPLQAQVQESPVNPLGILHAVCLMLETLGLAKEAESLNRAIIKTMEPIELIGSNMRTADIGGSVTAEIFMETLLDHLHGFLQAVNSAEAASSQSIRHFPVTKRRPMGMIEKIMTHNGVGLEVPEVKPGDMICVKVGWILTSELLWAGMEKTYNQMKRPRLYRNDRLWLAVDHTVDPRTNHQPRQRKLIEKAEEFQREAKIIDFLPANTSIMHTDFTRERALPGQIVIGSDSHTCSSGSMGAFAVGFGAADVVLPMVTGETWFRVPEVCRIDFVGKLPFGSSGKDVILYILGVFKRNTIAFQRAVEYGGPGLKELSMDARFAISNMTTEFGGMGSCFEADENTAAWIAQRRHSQHRGGLYFRADPGSRYAERRIIDLSEVKSTIALYPNPDNVVPVAEKIGMKLDGCFIGACTTTEEDLIVGALILDAALKAGTTPVSHGKRRVTPGSLKIIRNLERRGLLDIYRQAKFDIGAPGCSYCVGINDVDVAGKGEVWLSSQNRNFRNRMGMGSFGNVTCAAVVAASSFNMTVTDPAPLWERLNKNLFQKYVMHWKYSASIVPETQEPAPEITEAPSSSLNFRNASKNEKSKGKPLIRSKVQRFAENVDT